MVFGCFWNDWYGVIWCYIYSIAGNVGSPESQFLISNLFWVMQSGLLPKYLYLVLSNNLTSIYTYIDQRLGLLVTKLPPIFFSRTIGSAFRLYLVVIVLQRFVLTLFKFVCSNRFNFSFY
jgi:hypothetical protein